MQFAGGVHHFPPLLLLAAKTSRTPNRKGLLKDGCLYQLREADCRIAEEQEAL